MTINTHPLVNLVHSNAIMGRSAMLKNDDTFVPRRAFDLLIIDL